MTSSLCPRLRLDVQCVYLLRSLHPQRPNTTYIGYTNHPARRIRQHNGEIVQGARRTKQWRPWEMCAVIYGFPNKTTALQFEWAWQHPRISRIVKEATKGIWHKKGIKAKLNIMSIMLNLDPWKHYNLSIHINTDTTTTNITTAHPSTTTSTTTTTLTTAPIVPKTIDVYKILTKDIPVQHRLPDSILSTVTYGSIASMKMYTEALRLYTLISEKNKQKRKKKVNRSSKHSMIEDENDNEDTDSLPLSSQNEGLRLIDEKDEDGDINDTDDTSEILVPPSRSPSKRTLHRPRRQPKLTKGTVTSPKIYDISSSSSSSSDNDDNESLDSLIDLEISNGKDLLFGSSSSSSSSSSLSSSSFLSSVHPKPQQANVILLIDDDSDATGGKRTRKTPKTEPESSKRSKQQRSSSKSSGKTRDATLGIIGTTMGSVACMQPTEEEEDSDKDDDPYIDSEDGDSDDIISISDEDDDNDDDAYGLTQDNDENDDKLMGTQENDICLPNAPNDDIEFEYTQILPLRERLALRKARQSLSSHVNIEETTEIPSHSSSTVSSGMPSVHRSRPPLTCTLCHNHTDDIHHPSDGTHSINPSASIDNRITPTPGMGSVYDSDDDDQDEIFSSRTTGVLPIRSPHNSSLRCPFCSTCFHLFCLSDYAVIYQSKTMDKYNDNNETGNRVSGTSASLLFCLVPSNDNSIPCPNQQCNYQGYWSDWINLLPLPGSGVITARNPTTPAVSTRISSSRRKSTTTVTVSRNKEGGSKRVRVRLSLL